MPLKERSTKKGRTEKHIQVLEIKLLRGHKYEVIRYERIVEMLCVAFKSIEADASQARISMFQGK